METVLPPQTPQSTASIAELLRRTDLRPSPEVNALFAQLVSHSLNSQETVNNQLQTEVRRMAAEGETHMERHWARRIIDDPDQLQDFPYLDNYLELSAHEYESLLPFSGDAKSWAFIGSGPLPLSAIMLERLHGSGSFTYIDSDVQAHRLGRAVASTLNGPAAQREFITAPAEQLRYGNYDVIIVAALVGADEAEKHSVLNTIAETCKPSAIVASRSVPADNRTLLYPRLETTPPGYQLLAETQPPAGVINNLVIMQKHD